MRFNFNHPAVVTGTWENGNIRRELVRVAAEFEIVEYSDAEAPRTFDVHDRWQDQNVRIRTVGGRHYKRWRWDEPHAAFGPESQLIQSLYNGKELDFAGIEAMLDSEVTRVKTIDAYRGIENTDRKPLKREAQAGLSSLAVSGMKAPILKNWQWLGPDTESEVATWRERISAMLANIAFVDGIPHVRTFEPCYQVSRTQLGSGSGVLVSVENARFYAKEVDRTLVDPKTGFEILGKNALMIGAHNFSPLEFQDLRRFCVDAGWGSDDSPRYDIVTHDTDAVGIDYLEMETVRHARILHDHAGRMLKNSVKRDDGVEVYYGQQVDTHRMLAQLEALRVAILRWQSERNGTDHLAAPFEDLLDHVLHLTDSQFGKPAFGITEQMESFGVREDMAPVVVAPVAGATPCA
ncbi:hypothetical protein [Rhizobium sp. BK176]|uniref:hypothetical protein n=1 Tax=Rhizobium sp. BK176 TaxID=2587071 RepID=UPI00216944B3|nr:hypothetical protein [Rhizobium sp. BK176]MCS4090212.1 hypothetical protein [Rhizobium sp. BK176]